MQTTNIGSMVRHLSLVVVACGSDPTDSDPTVPPPPVVCDVPVQLVDTSSPDHAIACTESALRAAASAGGVIAFDCGTDPVTITLTASLRITADTVIDGGGNVAISGGGAVRIIDMNSGNFAATGPHLTVQRLTLRDGHAEGAVLDGGGGAIYYVGGSVTAIDCQFQGNQAAELGPDVAGGAIYGIGVGETVVVGSVFSGNRASNGGAIGALHTAVTIVNSTLTGNRATGYGANFIDQNGQQQGMGGNGGALVMDGRGRDLYICGSNFAENSSGAYGGAVFRTGYQSERNEIHRSSFLDNEVRDRTGAESELPSRAGALYLQGVDVTMTASTVAGNHAAASAGVWIMGHGTAPGVANLVNVTIAGNYTYERDPLTSRGVGAGLTVGDNTTGTLLNVTIAGNAAQFGSGIWNAAPLTIRNSIIANDADNVFTPLNCGGGTSSAEGDHNVQWPNGMSPSADLDCTPAIVRVDPQMGELGDHGGPTSTLLPGNPSLPEATDCPAIDQRGEPRGEPCTIGAVEL